MIKPTNGSVVWFWSAGRRHGDQPEAALIVYVHSDRLVNLVVFNADGIPYGMTRIRLLQDDEVADNNTSVCQWMP